MTALDERQNPPCINCGGDMTFWFEGVLNCIECGFAIAGLDLGDDND